MDKRATGKTATSGANMDDWDTDPDFIHDIDEVSQRWGSKRTVGSINMNDLIDEVRREHKAIKDRFLHSSQRDNSTSPKICSKDSDYGEYHESRSSSEFSRKVTTSSKVIREGNVDEAKRLFSDQTREPGLSSTRRVVQTERVIPEPKHQVKTTSETRSSYGSSGGEAAIRPSHPIPDRLESNMGSSDRRGNLHSDFKSMQDKIDNKFSAFKKEIEDLENRMGQKGNISQSSTKTTKNIERDSTTSNVEYATRAGYGGPGESDSKLGSPSYRPVHKSPPTLIKTVTEVHTPSPMHSWRDNKSPSGETTRNIKSLSERFESLGREESENFRKQTEAKRREFFDQIKSQVRETRKGLDGFDTRDEDLQECERSLNEHLTKSTSSHREYGSPTGAKGEPRNQRSPASPNRPSSRLSGASEGASNLSSSLLNRPKVYTRRETTQECIVSKLVKENDKVIQNETKRNVEKISSCHGSSDEENTSIIDHKLRSTGSSPKHHQRESPIDRLKNRVPLVEPEVKGAGLMARTLYDYQAVESDELSFDVDDLITNIEKLDSGWYKGTITDKEGCKRVGLFPANYVKLLNDNTADY